MWRCCLGNVVSLLFVCAMVQPILTIGLEPATEDPIQSEEESINYLLVLSTLILTIFLTYGFLRFDFKYLPESIVTIFVGAVLGGILLFNGKTVNDVFKLNSNTFYLFLLPPIIFESGYNLKKVSICDIICS